MDLLPAIDILDGKAVRLAKGDYHAVTVYNDSPVAQASIFKEQGARWIHVVDLNGARSGIPENITLIEQIIRETGLKIEVGGGIRSLDTIERLASAGVSRVQSRRLNHFLICSRLVLMRKMGKWPLQAGVKGLAFPQKNSLPR